MSTRETSLSVLARIHARKNADLHSLPLDQWLTAAGQLLEADELVGEDIGWGGLVIRENGFAVHSVVHGIPIQKRLE